MFIELLLIVVNFIILSLIYMEIIQFKKEFSSLNNNKTYFSKEVLGRFRQSLSLISMLNSSIKTNFEFGKLNDAFLKHSLEDMTKHIYKFETEIKKIEKKF